MGWSNSFASSDGYESIPRHAHWLDYEVGCLLNAERMGLHMPPVVMAHDFDSVSKLGPCGGPRRAQQNLADLHVISPGIPKRRESRFSQKTSDLFTPSKSLSDMSRHSANVNQQGALLNHGDVHDDRVGSHRHLEEIQAMHEVESEQDVDDF